MSNNENYGAKLVQLANSKGKVPILQLTKDKALAAQLSKAIDSTFPVAHTPAGSRKIEQPNEAVLHTIASQTQNNLSHSNTIMQMLPDLQMGAQILVSSVASPKDQMTNEFSYTVDSDMLPPTVLAGTMEILKDHYDKNYKFKEKTPRIIHEVLFETGAHILAILPENAVDEMINRNNAISMENFREVMGQDSFGPANANGALTRNLGILGPGIADLAKAGKRGNISSLGFNIGNESIDDVYNGFNANTNAFSQQIHVITPKSGKHYALEGLNITDNPNILRMPLLADKMRNDQITAKLGINRLKAGLEAYLDPGKVKLDDRSLKNLIYKPRRRGLRTMQVFKTDSQLDRRSIGMPLLMELPTEAVVPICTPGREDHHVGYLVLLDENGYPVKAGNHRDSFMEMSSRLDRAGSQTNNLTNRLKQLTEGLGCTSVEYTGQMARIHADLVEQDLLARFRNGKFANRVQLVKNQEFYNIMLARNYQQQQTTILFLPIDAVTYFARKYNQYGIGVSILDEMKMLNNQRAIATMANTILGIKNSIPRTNVDMVIDETDPDPIKTGEMFLQEIMRINQTAVPFGASAPGDIADFLQRAQYQINITGHPGIPDTTVTYNESTSNYSKVDKELEESLERRSAMAMGLQPDTINNGFNQETATSVVTNNLMLSRRVQIIQDQLNPHFTDMHRKVARVDEDLQDKLRELLFNEYESLEIDEEEIAEAIGKERAGVKPFVVEHILIDLIETLEVKLPRPNSTTIENQSAALDAFTALLDKALDSYISDAFFTDELGGELSRNTDAVKKMLMAHYTRQFMAENAIMPELAQLTSIGPDGKAEINLWETQAEYIEKLMVTMSGFMKRIHKTKMDTNEVVNNLNEIAEDAGASSGDYGSSSSSSSDNSGDGDGDSTSEADPFGMGDMDFGMDTGVSDDAEADPEGSEPATDGDATAEPVVP